MYSDGYDDAFVFVFPSCELSERVKLDGEKQDLNLFTGLERSCHFPLRQLPVESPSAIRNVEMYLSHQSGEPNLLRHFLTTLIVVAAWAKP